MSKLIKTLFAGIETNYISLEQLDSWATEIISTLSEPAIWLLYILGCSSTEMLLDVLRSVANEIGLILDQEYTDLSLGFIYLKYKNGEMTLAELESSLIDYAGYEDNRNFDVEKIFQIFKDKKNVKKLELEIDKLAYIYSINCHLQIEYVFGKKCLDKEMSLLSA